MSKPMTQTMEHVISDHLPQAGWMVEGAFRFDQHLLTLLSFMAQYYPPRQVTRALGAPPCAWSLDLYGRRMPMNTQTCAHVLSVYAQVQVGVVLAFDNPLVAAEDLEDTLGHRLVQLLLTPQYNPTGRNAVCVASEALAAVLRERYPGLPLICHQNRLIMAAVKRTPGFYEKLGESYREIILHPRDAVNAEFISRLKQPWKYIAVMNDPVPRNYAARRELLQMVAEQRRRPWDAALDEAKDALASRTGVFATTGSSNLTREEESTLYNAGVRSFMLQSFAFRNELTLFWDMFYHMFRTQPEYAGEAALIASAGMAYIRENVDDVPSGLKLFNFADN